ncbi:Site-specific recombinase XerD [Streptomyces sp. WMMB 714]|uniref:site-specific integrase n=1 Tax=Streptomyces sp. WMMB 714 TaxID=1286822 RepID=UPI0005F837FF|nr:site-specific integrase [Streptomyces sp. WMMB 714]SCK37301.1 Site-specific recombinase XerD [Streptomyces sp. WMMB 714]
MSNPIKKLPPNAKGQVRYRFVVDAGTDPITGKRRQLTVTRNTLTEAKNEYGRIVNERATGQLVLPSKTTVADLMTAWLKVSTADVEAATKRSYEDGARYSVTFCGQKPAQQLTEDDVDALVAWMLTSARRFGGKPGTGLGSRTVALALFCLRSALKLGVRRGVVARNVAADTKIPKAARKATRARERARKPWNEDEVRVFLAHVAGDRLHAPLLLSLCGLRPAEVCGLRWSAVDLEAGTLSVEFTRTLIAGEVIEKDTKSEAGERVLPLPAVVAAALKTFRRRQKEERLAAGEGYEPSGFVLVDELGRAVTTEWLRHSAYRLMRSAAVRKVRLYDARHACLSWMANNGVPDVVVSAWAGHADLSFTKRRYVHSDPQSLAAGSEKLGELLG